jgi:hypothetical protein
MQVHKGLLCVGLLHAGLVMASPADYVYTPLVESGEKEIDFKFGTAKDADKVREHAASIGFGYGATDYWFTELYLKRETAGSEGVTLAEWENKFQLTEAGKYPVDIGLITEIEAPLSNKRHTPYEFKFGPLFQTEFGKLQLNGNVLFERQFGPSDEDEKHVTEIGYQWQVKYRWQQELEFGLQGMGDMGKWNHWEDRDQQNHRMGPAVFGKLGIAQHQAIRYNAAWLFGVSDAAPNNTFRMQVEYEF